jgi:hypothetical protein
MIDHTLRVALCHSATARAHLAGAEAAELERQADALAGDPPAKFDDATASQRIAFGLACAAQSARRRYWREVASAQLLLGYRWPEAEALGVEPATPVVISQED